MRRGEREEVTHRPRQSPSPQEEAAAGEGTRVGPAGASELRADVGCRGVRRGLAGGRGLCVSPPGAVGWGQRDLSPLEVSATPSPSRLRGLRGAFPCASRTWEKPKTQRPACSLRVAEAQRGQSPSSACTAQRGFFPGAQTLISVPPRLGLALKSREGRGRPGPPISRGAVVWAGVWRRECLLLSPAGEARCRVWASSRTS